MGVRGNLLSEKGHLEMWRLFLELLVSLVWPLLISCQEPYEVCDGGSEAWGCCTPSRQCGVGGGDCDNDSDCQAGLVCGEDNCIEFSAQALNTSDCCHDPLPGCDGGLKAWGCCTPSSLCGVGKGDCDSYHDCEYGLICGVDNCAEFNPGARPTSDCCYDPLMIPTASSFPADSMPTIGVSTTATPNISTPTLPGFYGCPLYRDIPETGFQCEGRMHGGYYADVDTCCQVFHVCTNDGRGGLTKHSFLCPPDTLFQENIRACDWWYKVNCPQSV